MYDEIICYSPDIHAIKMQLQDSDYKIPSRTTPSWTEVCKCSVGPRKKEGHVCLAGSRDFYSHKL